MVMGFIGLLVNIPVNYIFIYGHFGMPELGGVGCGVATAAVYWVMFLAMVSYIKRARSMRDIRNEKGTAKPDPAVMKRLIQLGLPIALALFFEVTLFAVVALLVSPLGIVDVAGHQIALNFSSLMFVLPMSLAAAVTIRVGYRLGQGSTLDAQTAARAYGGCLYGNPDGHIHGFTAGANRPVVQRQSRGCNAGCAFDVAGGGISDF